MCSLFRKPGFYKVPEAINKMWKDLPPKKLWCWGATSNEYSIDSLHGFQFVVLSHWQKYVYIHMDRGWCKYLIYFPISIEMSSIGDTYYLDNIGYQLKFLQNFPIFHKRLIYSLRSPSLLPSLSNEFWHNLNTIVV